MAPSVVGSPVAPFLDLSMQSQSPTVSGVAARPGPAGRRQDARDAGPAHGAAAAAVREHVPVRAHQVAAGLWPPAAAALHAVRAAPAAAARLELLLGGSRAAARVLRGPDRPVATRPSLRLAHGHPRAARGRAPVREGRGPGRHHRVQPHQRVRRHRHARHHSGLHLGLRLLQEDAVLQAAGRQGRARVRALRVEAAGQRSRTRCRRTHEREEGSAAVPQVPLLAGEDSAAACYPGVGWAFSGEHQRRDQHVPGQRIVVPVCAVAYLHGAVSALYQGSSGGRPPRCSTTSDEGDG
ncbi:hypothetical protein ON010_g1275 [Phytophthora cinnamomi]|nr:hypothetical protein ON010_g1275 [Phytophthora cinnamomi]